MSVRSRAGRTWDSVKPRTRRGAIIAAAAIVVGAAVLSIVFVAGIAMAWNPYLDYTVNRDANARQWAVLPLSFTSSDTCQRCHEPQHARLAGNPHREIGCQSCHGALAEHAASGQDATVETVEVRVPTDAVCIRCHSVATGRPAGFKQITPGQHYVSQCLECHDPHTAKANRPPVVMHPLENIPPCLTCHGPDGFKTRNQRHPAGTQDDQRCLECHGPGRGPSDGGNVDGETSQ